MPFTRSSRLKSIGDGSKPNKELGRKPNEGTVPLRRSARLKYKGELPREDYKYKLTIPRMILKLPLGVEPTPPKWKYLTMKQLAEFALRDYNKKHGTNLVYVRLSCGKVRDSFGPGYKIDFTERYTVWTHFNFEARQRRNGDLTKEPLLLFAEVYEGVDKYYLSALMLINPEDEAYGCPRCWSYIGHPRHGYRAGFDTSVASDYKRNILSEQDAARLSEFALQDYNEKHGTNLKFERALQCNSFTCEGLLMDFSKMNTTWVHMNFEARVGPNEKILRLFAELYLGDDDKYVLATMSAAEPSDAAGEWKKKFLVHECAFCPDDIRHPWHGYRYAFNDPPFETAPDIYAKARGWKLRNLIL